MSKSAFIIGLTTGLTMVEAYRKFVGVAGELERSGYRVVNPMDYICDGDNFNTAMRKLIPLMLQCNELYLMPCWKDSEAARLLNALATRLQIPVIYGHQQRQPLSGIVNPNRNR